MLSHKLHYLQIALNSTLDEAHDVIQRLPISERILIEAGTPLIKSYGTEAISRLYAWWRQRIVNLGITPYIVADLKCMDRGESEVKIACQAGASAAVALGQAPIETIDSFISCCGQFGIDSMVDMIGVEQPIKTLRRLKKPPSVVVLHRGVDEEMYNPDKPIPYIQINKVVATTQTLISVAGGDTIRDVGRAIFNGANIVVVWKNFYRPRSETSQLANEFLKEIK